MSCFIVSDDTISKIAKMIHIDYCEFLHSNYSVLLSRKDKEKLLKILKCTHEELCPSIIFKALKKLNLQAYNSRYGEKIIKSDLQGYNKNVKIDDLVSLQMYKSLQCFLYQCMEGQYKKKQMYNFMEKIEHKLIDFLMSQSEEYKALKWG